MYIPAANFIHFQNEYYVSSDSILVLVWTAYADAIVIPERSFISLSSFSLHPAILVNSYHT